MPANNPFRCSFAAMAPRGANEVVLLDTGSYPGFSEIQNATFTWDGTDWEKVDPAASPIPKRKDFALSYDGYNVLMFGGMSYDAPQNDTWSWNGTTWVKLAPATTPFGRFGAKLAHLAATAPKAVMFGGATPLELNNETWVWNGHSATLNWVKAAPSTKPAARIDHAFAGGPDFCVLFGGKTNAVVLGDTWTFDGTNWTKLDIADGPAARSGAVMVYDVTNDEWVLFGGSSDVSLVGETWVLNGDADTWTKKVTAVAPSARVGAQMCFDPDSETVILMGGTDNYDTFNDTWSWDGTDWTKL